MKAHALQGDSRDARWDAMRAVGIVAVVMLHAAGPYCSRPLPGLLWPVFEPAHSLYESSGVRGAGATDLAFWMARSFAVPLFFFVAGIFAGRSLLRDTPREFLRARSVRLWPPLLAGLVLVLPVMYVIWTWGWVQFGWAAWEQLPRGRFGPAIRRHFIGPAHLWYLFHLLLACLFIAPIGRRIALAGQRQGPWMSNLFGLALVVTIGAICGWASRRTLHEFPNWFVPHPTFFAYHFSFFVWGTFASGTTRATDARASASRLVVIAILLALGLWTAKHLAPRIALGLHDAPNEPPPAPIVPSQRALHAGIMAASAACTIIGLVMLFSRDALARRLAPLGRASLWIYTTHLVWIGLCAAALYRRPLAPEVKACIACAVGLLVPIVLRPLASRTLVGRLLGA